MIKINNLNPRNHIQIKNKYIIYQKLKDDFILNIYYINENKVYMILRKINNMEGWNINISVQIFDIHNYKNIEEICIGTSKKNYKKINIYSKKIKFEKMEIKNLKIPKIIFQTNKSHYFENNLAYNSILSFIEFNPDYSYQFFDDIESREFIKKHFNEKYLKYYDILYPGAFKADFFRYCYLYINGGFYFDNKSILLVSLNTIINENDELILCQDHHKLGYYNAVMMSIPKHKIFMKLLDAIIYKIENFKSIYNPYQNINYSKLDNILSLTGPNLLCEIFNAMNLDYNKHILMKHDILGNYQNYKNLVVTFKKNLFLYKNYHQFNIHNPNHYSKLWIKHLLFNKIYNNNDYVFFVKPLYNVEDYSYYFINKKLLIISNKLISPFELNIIDNYSNINKIDIPMINSKYYLFDYEYTNNFNLDIKNIDCDCDCDCDDNQNIKDNINKNNKNNEINKLKFEINKIENNYYLIILNEQKIRINVNNVEFCINELNNFNVNINIKENDIYLIKNIELNN